MPSTMMFQGQTWSVGRFKATWGGGIPAWETPEGGAKFGEVRKGDELPIIALREGPCQGLPFGQIGAKSRVASRHGAWVCLAGKGKDYFCRVGDLDAPRVLTAHAAPDGDTFALTLTSMSGEEVCAFVLDRANTERDLFEAAEKELKDKDDIFDIMLESGVKLAVHGTATLAQLFADSAQDVYAAQEELI